MSPRTPADIAYKLFMHFFLFIDFFDKARNAKHNYNNHIHADVHIINY